MTTEWTESSYETPYLRLAQPSVSDQALADLFDLAGSKLVELKRPHLWPSSRPEIEEHIKTNVQLAWNEHGLHALYRVYGPFREPTSNNAEPSADSVDNPKMRILDDSRVEIFIIPNESSPTYFAYEMNRQGQALDFKAKFGRQFDYQWQGNATGVVSKQSNDQSNECLYYLTTVPWSDLEISEQDQTVSRLPDVTKSARVGLYRGEVISDIGKSPVEHAWHAWIDPCSEEISFHVPQTFARLRLQSAQAM